MKIERVSLERFKQLLSDNEPTEGVAPIKVVPAVVTTHKELDGKPVERIQTWQISDGSVDREGDTIDPNGGQFENFLNGGSVLFGHDARNPTSIIGKPLAVWVENNAVMSRAEFVSRDINPLGFMVYRMAEEGFVRAASIGFLPKEVEEADRKGFMPMDFKVWELLEWSVLPVAANPNTGKTDREMVAAAKGLGIDVAPLIEWSELMLDGEAELLVPREVLEEIHAEAKGAVFASVPDEVEKGAISYARAHPDGTSKANEDTPWNGSAERAAAEVDDLKVMSAWVDSANDEKKGAYKLHHHKADGHALVWNGVKAAMGALLGARGGVNIPDGDRKGVYNHLKKHYKEFDKDAPEFKELDEFEIRRVEDNVIEPVDEIAEALRLADEYATKALDGVLSVADRLIDVVSRTQETLAKSERPLPASMVERLTKARDAINSLLPIEEPTPQPVVSIVPPEFERAFDALDVVGKDGPTDQGVSIEQVRDIANEFVGKLRMQLTGKVPDYPQNNTES